MCPRAHVPYSMPIPKPTPNPKPPTSTQSPSQFQSQSQSDINPNPTANHVPTCHTRYQPKPTPTPTPNPKPPTSTQSPSMELDGSWMGVGWALPLDCTGLWMRQHRTKLGHRDTAPRTPHQGCRVASPWLARRHRHFHCHCYSLLSRTNQCHATMHATIKGLIELATNIRSIS